MTVNINNTTNKIVKKIKISGESERKGHVLVPAVLVSGMGNTRPVPAAAPTLLPLVCLSGSDHGRGSLLAG